jgi:hypothetical protein
MAIIQSGASSTTLMTVDPTNLAARVTLRPNESTGSYRASLVSGTIAASTAAGVMYTFKYTGTGVCIIRSVQIGMQVTTAFVQGGVRFGMYIARTSFTQGTTGGTLTTFSVNKKRTSQATPNAAAVITSTASMNLTTNDTIGSLDAVAYNHILLNMPALISTTPLDGLRDFINPYNASAHPIVLAPNEGFRLQNDTVFPATGSGNLIVAVEWEEVASY